MISREQNLKAIRQIGDRFSRNAGGFVQAYQIWLCALFLAALADGLSTVWFMAHDGTDEEFHPVVRLVSYLLGPVFGPIVGKVCQFVSTLGVAIYFRQWARIILGLVALLYLWAAWFNVWGRYIYTPRLQDWLGG